MEVKWSINSRVRDNKDGGITLILGASAFIKVQGKKQKFNFSDEQLLPTSRKSSYSNTEIIDDDMPDIQKRVDLFTDRARKYFDSIRIMLRNVPDSGELS